MAIEPLLFLAALLFGVAVQVVAQARRSGLDAIAVGRLTRDAVQDLGGRGGWRPDPAARWLGWTRRVDELAVHVHFSRWGGVGMVETLARFTGVRHVRAHRHLTVATPSVLVLVQIPGAPSLRVSADASVVPRPVKVGDPVIDGVLRVQACDVEGARALLCRDEVRWRVLRLLRGYPLSVIGGGWLAVWCTDGADDVQPLVDEAVALARALAPPSALRGSKATG